MDDLETIRVLLVEDNDTDVMLLKEALSSVSGVEFVLTQVERLAESLRRLDDQPFDVVLLDLGLPDSQGLDTLKILHERAPDIPVLVLTALSDEKIAMDAMRSGAQDYLIKSGAEGVLMARFIRFAIERHRTQQSVEIERHARAREYEVDSIGRLSESSDMMVTARLFANIPLHEAEPETFEKLSERYGQLLDRALELRTFKEDDNSLSAEIRGLCDQLGYLRAGARDIVEIHSLVLKKKLKDLPRLKAQTYLEESRLVLVELLGDLLGYYRAYYPGTIREASG